MRTWNVTSRNGERGAYARAVAWTMRASDVVAGGPERYCDNVEAWAASIHAALGDPALLP